MGREAGRDGDGVEGVGGVVGDYLNGLHLLRESGGGHGCVYGKLELVLGCRLGRDEMCSKGLGRWVGG